MYFFLYFLGLLCVCSTGGCPINCICEEYETFCQIEQCSDNLPFEYTDFLKIKGILCQRHKDFLKNLSPNTIIVVTEDSCAGLHNCRDARETMSTEVTPQHNFIPIDEPEPLPEIVPPIEVPEMQPEPEPEQPQEPLPEIMPAPEPEPLPEIMPAPELEQAEPLPEQPEPEQAEPDQVEPEQLHPEQLELTTEDMTTEITTEPITLTTSYHASEEEEGNQSSTVSLYRG